MLIITLAQLRLTGFFTVLPVSHIADFIAVLVDAQSMLLVLDELSVVDIFFGLPL